MARRKKRRSGGRRRDWRQIAFYAFSIAIAVSMVLSLFAQLLML